MRRLVDYALWLCLGGGIVSCGPGLVAQVKLRQLADRAAADCKASKLPQKITRCEVALVCAKASSDAAKAIQAAQEARAGAGASAGQEAVAAGAYAAAVASCRTGGWR